MKKLLIAAFAVLAGAGISATPAMAQCPVCDVAHGNCLGEPTSGFKLCVQHWWGCELTPGQCDGDSPLSAVQLAPDGTVLANLSGGARGLSFEDGSGHVVTQYTVVGCQNYVVSRRYEAGGGTARRRLTAVMAI